MAQVSQQLPCDGEGVCMVCNKTSKPEETLTCNTCVTPWHAACLNNPPETLSATLHWDCPDCSGDAVPFGGGVGGSRDLIAAIRAIEADESLTAQEKAKKRQQLMSGASASCPDLDDSKTEKKRKTNKESDVLELLDESFKCSFCMQLPDRPVTTPCGHNFCLKCFEKWINQGNRTCVTCRASISQKMASHPRINSALVVAIRMAKISKSITSGGPSKVYHFYHNQNRPDKAFTTERAKKAGKANACSGKIFVTVPPDHFGPILAENDPTRNQGVLVGECWEDRMECRQWGAHMPHVAGIAGQGEYGAQSVALSGGYLDDEDHGEWFLYTGSGGRDLTGNKRTNKNQSFDQTFDKSNEALRVSCKKGYPVRVVRSYKEKRSSYAPETGVRYDGVYRIEKCWQKVGVQGFKVCRYLFVRCDNEPAPWTSDEHGDRPRPLPKIPELKKATDITARTEEPSWDYDEEENVWKWKKPSPASKKSVDTANPKDRRTERAANRRSQNLSVREKLLKEFICSICRKVMTLPLTTPCAHNFCKHCLEGVFAGKSFVRERGGGNRSLRTQKIVMKCPTCKNDISDFLKDPKVNREMMGMIESLQRKKVEEEQNAEVQETEDNYELEEDEENAEVEETEENAEVEDEDVENEVVEDSESEDPPKRRKVDSMDGKESEREGMKPVSVSGEIEHTEVDTKEANTPLQKSMDEVEDVLDSLSKISDDGKGDDGNESPSSPLHL